MNALKSSEGKNLSPNRKETSESWFKRIEYLEVIKRAGNLFWNHKKRLIMLSFLLLITGGQAITFNSSFSGNIPSGSPSSSQGPSDANIKGEPDWRETLSKIESQEEYKSQLRDLIENKTKLYSGIALATSVIIIIATILFVIFSCNCYLHLLLINTIRHWDNFAGRTNRKSFLQKDKKIIKDKIRGQWKKLALMRVIFGLVYLISLLLFMTPAAFFAWRKFWAMAITMGGLSLPLIFIVFMMISYVFRYSLFYYALGKVGIKESIDCGYDVFAKFWRESLLTSLVNFALGIVAVMLALLIFFASFIVLALAAALVGLIIYLAAGMSHLEGIAIGVGSVMVAIPLFVVGIILAAVWQGFVVIFWYLIFTEITGCKLPAIAKEPVLAKTKKKPAPVVQTK